MNEKLHLNGDICFIGQKKVGKTSIIQTIFKKVHPQDTQYIDSTSEVQVSKVEFRGFFNMDIYDFPGFYEANDLKEYEKDYLRDCGAIIYVVDYKAENLQEAANHFKDFYKMLQDINPKASINIFFHQIDNDLSGEENSREIWRIFIENLEDTIDNNPLNRANTSQLNYYLTSIYDHSILETMSKIVSKIVSNQIKILPKMMNDISSHCNLDKVYLFDMMTKLFLMTDFVPLDLENFAICADMLDVFMDFACIYGDEKNSKKTEIVQSKDQEPNNVLIKLSDGKVLYMQQIVRHVTIVLYFNEDFLDRKNIIDYNIKIFRDNFVKIVEKMKKNSGDSTLG